MGLVIRISTWTYCCNDDEDENITQLLETFYEGEVGDTWQDVAQVAAEDWDYDEKNFIVKNSFKKWPRKQWWLIF